MTLRFQNMVNLFAIFKVKTMLNYIISPSQVPYKYVTVLKKLSCSHVCRVPSFCPSSPLSSSDNMNAYISIDYVMAYDALFIDKEREEEKEKEKEMMGRKQHIRKITEDLDSNRSLRVNGLFFISSLG